LNNELIATNNGNIIGEVVIPGDKSISHRAVILGSLARGKSKIDNCLMGDDVLATIRVFKNLGIDIKISSENTLMINGCDMSVAQNEYSLDLGNSGTSIRLIIGLLAGMGIAARLTGDESLQKRPMRRVTDPLKKMGARIELTNNEYPPVVISGTYTLKPIDFKPPMASAQVKSAVLLAGLNCTGKTVVREKIQTRDHTERMLSLFGGDIQTEEGIVCLTGNTGLKAVDFSVPGDFSSAAFLMVGAIIANQGDLLVKNVGLNPTRTGLLRLLREMGARIEINITSDDFEPVGDIRVYQGGLTGITVDPSLIPSAIDEFPIFFIAAACATGVTILRGAQELRYKESDRLEVMANGLRELGIKLKQHDDGMEIEGGAFTGGSVDAKGDHRCAMSFIIASLRASKSIKIMNTKQISTSFPSFLKLVNSLGLTVR
tara:strand:+ start:4878 stop:6170 length:1293 start_codon:yes stop_codon:yes gene_type:complete